LQAPLNFNVIYSPGIPDMTSSDRADWLIPAGLVTLSAIPTVAGIFRVVQLAVGTGITPDNARFIVAPLPVVMHILSSVIFCVLGAFQFSPGLRRRHPPHHGPPHLLERLRPRSEWHDASRRKAIAGEPDRVLAQVGGLPPMRYEWDGSNGQAYVYFDKAGLVGGKDQNKNPDRWLLRLYSKLGGR